VAGFSGYRRDSAHESAANAENVDVQTFTPERWQKNQSRLRGLNLLIS
jgi:hypothetical protein